MMEEDFLSRTAISPYTNRPITKSVQPKRRTFMCKACQITLNSPVSVLQHFRGRSHKNNVEMNSFKQMDDSNGPKDELKSTPNGHNKNHSKQHTTPVDKKRKGQLLPSKHVVKKGKIQPLMSSMVNEEEIPSLMSQSVINERFPQSFISSPGVDERMGNQRISQSLAKTNSQPNMLQPLHDARNRQPLLLEPFQRVDQHVLESTINGRITPLMSNTTVYESFSGTPMPQSLVDGRLGNPSSVPMGRVTNTELVADEGLTHFTITKDYERPSAIDKAPNPSPNPSQKPSPHIGPMDLNDVPSNGINVSTPKKVVARCVDCNISLKNDCSARDHFQGKRHKKTIAAKQLAAERDIMSRWQQSGTGTGLRLGAGGHHGRLWRNKRT